MVPLASAPLALARYYEDETNREEMREYNDRLMFGIVERLQIYGEDDERDKHEDKSIHRVEQKRETQDIHETKYLQPETGIRLQRLEVRYMRKSFDI